MNNSLHFINLTTNTVEKSIFIGSSPVDMAINLAGTELYVANFGSTEIAVVNLDTREKARSILVDTTTGTWDGNPYRSGVHRGRHAGVHQPGPVERSQARQRGHRRALHVAGSLYSPQLAPAPTGASTREVESPPALSLRRLGDV